MYRERFVAGAVRNGIDAQSRRRHLRVHRAVRRLRLSQGSRRGVRLDRLSDRVPQGEPSARVPRCADDVGRRQDRQARRVSRGRAQARHRRAAARRQRVAGRLHGRRRRDPVRPRRRQGHRRGRGARAACCPRGRAVRGPVRFRAARRGPLDQPQGARGADHVRRAATGSAATARNCSTRSIRRSRSPRVRRANAKPVRHRSSASPATHEELRPQLRALPRAADAAVARVGEGDARDLHLGSPARRHRGRRSREPARRPCGSCPSAARTSSSRSPG